ncbi:MAG: hypothetical protein R3B99_16955 [Polyangiales bacterium]
MLLHRLYRYVEPPDLALAARRRSGMGIASRADAVAAFRELGGRREPLVCTYVVDGLGGLRVADRSSEHVDCASGGPVLCAGELTLGPEGEVLEASNLSTGFCPEPTVWPAFAAAIEELDAAMPTWSHAFDFRRCDCGARVVLKDDPSCPECDRTLPERWTFERALVRRGFVTLGDVDWVVDVIEEAAERDEDRVRVVADSPSEDPGLLIALADGAGGTPGGRATAETLVDRFATERPRDVPAMQRLLAACEVPGRASIVVARLRANGTLLGLSAGDCRADARAGAWHSLTEGQPHARAGDGVPGRPFALAGVDAAFVASDGLWKALGSFSLERSLDVASPDLPFVWADTARGRGTRPLDDVSAVIVRRIASSSV